MKKRLSLVLALVLIFCTSFSFNAFGTQSTDIARTQIGTSDIYYEFDASTGTLTVSGTGAIPDMKNTSTSQPWYNWRSDGSISRVVIGEGITAIGTYNFYSVKATGFTLPSTLRTIGRYSFSSSSIRNAALPFGVTSIAANAFDTCTELASVTLPDSLKTIAGNAFKVCTSLEEIEIPYSVMSIGSYAFDRCTSLETLKFSAMTASVSLGTYAFYDCTSLTTVAFPQNATLSKNAFGFGRSGAISGAEMLVYDSSNAHIYATSNSISYQILDEKYELELGVPETVTYDENTLDKAYAFTYTPDFSGTYNFYSRGETDVKAALYNGTDLIAESDDVSGTDRNFCLTANLTAGVTYTYKVSSMMSQGSATVIVYPDEIQSFDVIGSLTFNASDGFHSTDTAYFPIVDSALSDFILDIRFAGGYSDKIYYKSGYFNNRQIALADTQTTHPFTCGENAQTVAIGEVTSDFAVYVNHEYTATVVPYTAYEDGYTLHTCILCGDSYKDEFVPTPAVTVSGRCMLATAPDGSYSSDFPLDNITVTFQGNTYHTDENGYFYFRTFLNGELMLSSPYCDSIALTVNEGEDAEFGVIPMAAYDFNRDGYINGRDLAVFKTELQDDLGKDYFSSAVNFM